MIDFLGHLFGAWLKAAIINGGPVLLLNWLYFTYFQ